MKVCIKCGEMLPLADYHRAADRFDGHREVCKICRLRKLRESHVPKRSTLDSKLYYRLHKIKSYGISVEEYVLMMDDQRGCCKICQDSMEERICIDHCHDTGDVRGLLCHKCNTALGLLRDDVTIMSRAISYLEGTT